MSAPGDCCQKCGAPGMAWVTHVCGFAGLPYSHQPSNVPLDGAHPSSELARLRVECDAANARADAAEKERDEAVRVNESVAVCPAHTGEMVEGPSGMEIPCWVCNTLDANARVAELEQALREELAFAETVLLCDTYGCENGPGKCLHADAAKAADAARAALRVGQPQEDGDHDRLCPECGRDFHGYSGPLCRYCDGTAE